MSKDEIVLLVWETETGRFATAADVRDWIEMECGVRYTVAGVYSLMKRLNCR